MNQNLPSLGSRGSRKRMPCDEAVCVISLGICGCLALARLKRCAFGTWQTTCRLRSPARASNLFNRPFEGVQSVLEKMIRAFDPNQFFRLRQGIEKRLEAASRAVLIVGALDKRLPDPHFVNIVAV